MAGTNVSPMVAEVTLPVDNHAPTNIALSANNVDENQSGSTAVGTLTTTDPDAGNTFTYTLAAGVGSTDNNSFSIGGNVLQTAATSDYETMSNYNVRVRSSDQRGLYFEKQFTVTVNNVNEPPTHITLLTGSIDENQPSGTAVGFLSATDPDAGDTFTYALANGTGGADNGSFSINGNTLQTAATFDYETKHSYTIRVRSIHQGGLSFEKQLTITVNNVNEPPAISVGGALITGGQVGFSFSGEPGTQVVVERCLGLEAPRVWLPVATNIMGGLPATFTDPDPATNCECFYRLRAQ